MHTHTRINILVNISYIYTLHVYSDYIAGNIFWGGGGGGGGWVLLRGSLSHKIKTSTMYTMSNGEMLLLLQSIHRAVMAVVNKAGRRS